MSATFANPSWPVPHLASRNGPWVFGREVVLHGAPGTPHALQWLLRRHFALKLRKLGLLALVLGGLSLLMAGHYDMRGATLVLASAGPVLLAAAFALAFFARHADDCELLTLVGCSLRVEQCVGARVDCTDFAADRLCIEPAAGQGSLVELSGQGQRVRVGRFLRPELRGDFARELRLALRRRAARSGTQTDSN